MQACIHLESMIWVIQYVITELCTVISVMYGSRLISCIRIITVNYMYPVKTCRIYWIVRYILHDTEKRASSSSSIRLFFTQIYDKDETDDTIKSMMLYL